MESQQQLPFAAAETETGADILPFTAPEYTVANLQNAINAKRIQIALTSGVITEAEADQLLSKDASPEDLNQRFALLRRIQGIPDDADGRQALARRSSTRERLAYWRN